MMIIIQIVIIVIVIGWRYLSNAASFVLCVFCVASRITQTCIIIRHV